MTKEEYQNSEQYVELKNTIDTAIKETEDLQNKTDLSDEDIECLVRASNKIMEHLRGHTIFLRNYYVNNDEYRKGYCTIDPKECIDLQLSQVEEGTFNEAQLELIKKGVVAIKGNSLGPYYPKEYFKRETFKIVWLLKESYIEKPSYYAGDRGGHDQASQYATYGVKGNPTHENLVEYTRHLLYKLGVIDINASDEQVMKHICVLEVNHFPGLAFVTYYSDLRDGVSNLIGRWTDFNIESIKKCLSFYSPDIVVGGGILKYLHDCKSYYDKIIEAIKTTPTKVLKDLEYVPDIKCANKKYINPEKNYIISTLKKGKEGPVFIQANHPTALDPNDGLDDGQRIKDLRNVYP